MPSHVPPAILSKVDDTRLAAEQRARVLIDRQLTGAGWFLQSHAHLNLFAGTGVAVREVSWHRVTGALTMSCTSTSVRLA